MIVVAVGDRLLFVTQSDHAHFSGELLSLWRDDGLPASPRRAEIVFAGTEHDNGWREADAAPQVDPATGAPLDFLTMPAADRVEIWRRGIARHCERHPHAALLIHQHALELHRGFAADGAYDALIDEIRASQEALYESSGIDPKAVAADYPLIRLSDALSLAACGCFPGRRGLEGRAFELEDGELVIDPLPLHGATRLTLPYRAVERRRFERSSELAVALAAARWEVRSVLVRGPRCV